jgi:hypothetical protein
LVRPTCVVPFLSAALAAVAAPPVASAAVITVTTTAASPGSSGDCTLGEAVTAAETNTAVDACTAGSGADTISLLAGTYTLVSGTTTAAGVSAFVVTTAITIQGNGAALTRNPATNNLRFFEVTSTGVLSLQGLSLTNGRAVGVTGTTGFGGGPGQGGAIHNAGSLTLTSTNLQGNQAQGGTGGLAPSSVGGRGGPGGPGQGGAISNAGHLTLMTVTSTDNSAEGGRGGASTNLGNFGGPGGLAQGGAVYHLATTSSSLGITSGQFVGNRTRGGPVGVTSPFDDAGDQAGEANGGALHLEPGETGSDAVLVIRSHLSANEAIGGSVVDGWPAVPASGLGGAISVVGVPLTLTESTLSGNVARGGFEDSGAAGLGGGLSVQYASASIVRTSIVHNVAVGGDGSSSDGAAQGGGVYAVESQLSLTNVTMSNNDAKDGGGGVYLTSSGNAAMSHVTAANNTSATGASGVALSFGATAIFAGTAIVTKGAAGSQVNCSGTVANLGGNLQFPGTTCGSGIPTADPLLEPLQEEGGTTVHPLGLLSPAVDAADQAGCPATDQRGVMRPIDGDDDGLAVCDTGAYEAVPNDLIFGDGFES